MNRGPMGKGPMGKRPMGKFGKPKNAGKTIARLFGYVFKVYPVQFIFTVFGIVFSALASLASNAFLEPLFDTYLKKDNIDKFAIALVFMGCIYLLGTLCSYLYNRLMITISQGVMKNIRVDLFKHMETLPIKYFDTNTHGDLMSRFTNDIDTLRMMISQSIPQIINSIITIVGSVILMVMKSWVLSLVVLVLIVVIMTLSSKIASKSGKHFMNQQRAVGAINGYIEEMIEGQKVVKVFCYEDKAKERFNVLNDDLCYQATTANTYGNILGPIMNNMGHLQYAILAIIGSLLAINKPEMITLGAVIAFLQIARHFTHPISQISQQISSIFMALAGAERIFNVMDEASEVDEGYVTLVNAKYIDGELVECPERTGVWAWKHPHHDGTLTYTEVKGDVRLFDVDFSYVPEKLVLKNVSLYAMPGQKIAFVGSTGAGKTTITNLINRFYDIADGKIRFDGININKIKKDDLRKSLGMVLQDTHLFTGTIKDNIRYGKLDATDEEIYEAARLANADSFIKHLPKGYDTEITGDGENLSQGQRQLLAIARAAVANPPVLILDEATSSIDTRTERLIEHGMDKLMEGRTVFVIAHRLSTVRNSHAIMVLEQGEIIERGSHDDLIAMKGKYYQLYTGAFELS